MNIKLPELPLKEIYDDLFKPGMKRAGEALATVLDISNLILLPLKLVNEKSKMYFEKNIKKYSDKLNDINLPVSEVPPYIGLPVLDKLTYLDENELRDAFINLLTKASFTNTSNLTHPAFITILNNLSVDEAKILFYCRDKQTIPYIDIYIHRYVEAINPPTVDDSKRVKSFSELKQEINYLFQDRQDTYIKVLSNLTGLEKEVDLIFPENIQIYLDNLFRNGIIYFEKELLSKDDLSKYEFLRESVYQSDIGNLRDELFNISVDFEYKLEIQVKERNIQFTELGKHFIKACIEE